MWRCMYVCLRLCANDLSDRGLAEVGAQDGRAGEHVRQRDVNQLIQTSRPQDRRINDIRPKSDRQDSENIPSSLYPLPTNASTNEFLSPVGGANDKDVLLIGHSIHFCQDLVDDPVSRTSCISSPATSCFSNRVQLIKEQNAWGRLPCLRPQQQKQSVIYISE